LLQELRQNQFGALPKETIQLCKTVESNADSMVSIVEAYMLQCEGVESFYERQQEKVVGSTLYMLTIVTVTILPVQMLTGMFGMPMEPQTATSRGPRGRTTSVA
jgi:Mg2+ and Co2+ transporter CorA